MTNPDHAPIRHPVPLHRPAPGPGGTSTAHPASAVPGGGGVPRSPSPAAVPGGPTSAASASAPGPSGGLGRGVSGSASAPGVPGGLVGDAGAGVPAPMASPSAGPDGGAPGVVSAPGSHGVIGGASVSRPVSASLDGSSGRLDGGVPGSVSAPGVPGGLVGGAAAAVPGPVPASAPGTSGVPDGGVPGWLRELAVRAAAFPVPAELRPPAEGGRPAAVLLLFGEGPDGPDILLIQRSSRGRLHAGQPAFPGGGVDPGDGGPIGAALREAQEETGLDPSGVAVVGTMPELYVWRSDNRVTPVLGWWHTPCAVHPAAPDEVDAVERVPIAELVDPRNRLRLRGPRGNIGPAFRVRGLLVWGFTAGVLSGVLTAAGFDRPWNRSRIEDLPPDMLNLSAR